MPIERRDSLLETIVKTKKPLAALRGRRTWSLLSKEVVVYQDHTPLNIVIYQNVVSPTGEDTLRYEMQTNLGFQKVVDSSQEFTGEEINDPRRPWNGKIRFRPK